jgi:hypothetical protein
LESATTWKTIRKRKNLMKLKPWWVGGGAGLAIFGLVAVAVGFFQPGWPEPVEIPPSGGKSSVVEVKQKTAEFRSKVGKLDESKKKINDELSKHRVFVSRSLVFLPKQAEPVQPLNPDQVTDDGIQVGWKLRYGFSPEDPGVAAQDEDQDGFTNLEEYEKKTNPQDPTSSPPKWDKVRISSVEKKIMVVSLAGKTPGQYTLRFKIGKDSKNVDVSVQIGDKLWVVSASSGVKILKGEMTDELKQAVAKMECPHVIPLIIKDYKEDVGMRMNPNTQTENEYDDSMLIIDRQDALGGIVKIMVNYQGLSRGAAWNVGDIRLRSSVPGEGEMGPYREGQTFTYSGQQFAVMEGSPGKVSLQMKPQGDMRYVLPPSVEKLSPSNP